MAWASQAHAATYTVPPGTTELTVTLTGAGGGGGGDRNSPGGKGGNGSQLVVKFPVTGGQTVTYTEGLGGDGGVSWSRPDPVGATMADRTGGTGGTGAAAGGAGGDTQAGLTATPPKTASGSGGGSSMVNVGGLYAAAAAAATTTLVSPVISARPQRPKMPIAALRDSVVWVQRQAPTRMRRVLAAVAVATTRPTPWQARVAPPSQKTPVQLAC